MKHFFRHRFHEFTRILLFVTHCLCLKVPYPYHTFHLRFLLVPCLILTLSSCVDTDEHDNTPTGNFEALWQIIDEHYCFFQYKDIDWNAVYNKYKVRVNDQMTETQLFEICCDMLSELRDGHVNLSSSMDYGRYWAWQESYPKNYSDSLERLYLGTDYKIASGLKYRVLDDNIGYIRCESFTAGIGEGNLDDVMMYLALCRGLIIDVRNNGGGDLTTAERFAGRFVSERTHIGYMQHKNGSGHADFSDLEPQYLEPSSNVRWHKKVCVLTNRSVYSAANAFAVWMHTLPHVTLIGDHTGGGSGMPMSNSLPNGWSVRYSACPMYDKNKNQTEFGIDPDIMCHLDGSFTYDAIIEQARQYLSE